MVAPAAPAPPEAAVSFEASDGMLVARWLCTPERLEDLALGWLFCEGLIHHFQEVSDLRATSASRVCAHLEDPVRRRLSAWQTETGPGPARRLPGTWSGSGSSRPDEALESLLADPGRLGALFHELFEGARLKEIHGGGLHTGGRVIDGRIVDIAEDVSRSAVVDKLVGRALHEGTLGGSAAGADLLLLSGRISATIAAKLSRAGVAAAATISVPTSLAVEIAERTGVVIVGRARRASPLRYGAR